jgi:hypothetical protein
MKRSGLVNFSSGLLKAASHMLQAASRLTVRKALAPINNLKLRIIARKLVTGSTLLINSNNLKPEACSLKPRI